MTRRVSGGEEGDFIWERSRGDEMFTVRSRRRRDILCELSSARERKKSSKETSFLLRFYVDYLFWTR